jgi:Membrane bound O-acyl transferase family
LFVCRQLEALHVLVAALTSVLVYKLIVQRQGTTLAYLLCYGLVIPFLFAGPFVAFSLFQIRNQFFRFAISAIVPVTCLFKTTAAAHGCLPAYATISLKRFAFVYSCPLPMEWNDKLDKWTPSSVADMASHLKRCIYMMVAFGTLQSTLNYYNPSFMPPMATGQVPHDWYDMKMLLYPQIWLPRNMLFGLYFQLMLSAMGEGLIIAQSLGSGAKVKDVMDNPIFTSRGFVAFWSSKWNLAVHEVLKIGVYWPVRKHWSKQTAMVSTFFASGLFHEVLLWMCLYPIDDVNGCLSNNAANAAKVDCYLPRLFVTTLFFLWQAAGMAMEYSALGQLKILTTIPDLVMTALTVAVGAPLAHFFSEPYWNSLVFENSMMLFTMLKPVMQDR